MITTEQTKVQFANTGMHAQFTCVESTNLLLNFCLQVGTVAHLHIFIFMVHMLANVQNITAFRVYHQWSYTYVTRELARKKDSKYVHISMHA